MNSYNEALEKLRIIHAKASIKDQDYIEMENEKSEVLTTFQPIFSSDHIQTLTEEEFKSFLLFKLNFGKF